MKQSMDILIIGLSITSSWGNGHATTYRALVRELAKKGHRVTFLEHDKPWYASHRDMPNPPFGVTHLYQSLEDLKVRFKSAVQNADAVIVGSYVPEGVSVGRWVVNTATGVKAFYDIDTPVTLHKLREKDYEYLHPELIPQYDLYLSFTGGPTLDVLEKEFGSPKALPLYCSVDTELYAPEDCAQKWDLGYLGTFSDDRQPPLEKLMLNAARKLPEKHFVVAGPSYPEDIQWPQNLQRIDHLPPFKHRQFYNSQRFAMNITRKNMVEMGYAPSVRLFEAAACATPVISDYWEGLDEFFEVGKEILVSHSAEETTGYLNEISEEERKNIGRAAREKILHRHTAAHRAEELISYLGQVQKLSVV